MNARKTMALTSCAAVMAMFVAPALGQQPTPAAKTDLTTATFLMTGLQCPPCTQTIESSLRGAKGIRSVKVDWKTKAARIEFDETILAAQQVGQ